MYYGLSICEFSKLVYEFAMKCNIEYPVEWDIHGKASWDWYNAFMHRHPNLSLRTPEQISANRTKAFSKANVDAFFVNLDHVMFQKNIKYEPHRIWNMDETGCPTVPTKAVRVITLKGERRVGQKTSAERGTNVSLAFAVSAAGQSIPPFYIFPRKNMQSTFMDNALPGAMGVANESGWMTAQEFVKYLAHFIKHSKASKDSPILLLLDNHTSHLSLEAIQMAIDNGITMLSFPPHCSHRLQPLDVSVFGPFKKMFHNMCQVWMKNNIGKTLELRHIAPIADKCLEASATPKNIRSGFRAAGIQPFNPNVFSAEDYEAAELMETNLTSADADAINLEVPSPSTMPSTSTIPNTSAAPIQHILQEVGPLKHSAPIKKSNRGRKSMGSTILTSEVNVANLRRKSDEKKAKDSQNKENQKNKAAKALPSKRGRPRKSSVVMTIQNMSDSEDEDFCIICKGVMPKKLNRNNSIHCNTCDRPVHLKCANLTAGYYTCIHCESD